MATPRQRMSRLHQPSRFPKVLALALVYAIAAPAPRIAAAQQLSPSPLELSTDDQRSLQIEVQPLRPGKLDPTVHGFAQVLDAAPLVTLVNDRHGAQIAAQASTAAAKRLELLHQDDLNASLKNLQTAQAAAAADAARVQTLNARVAMEWSPALAHGSAHDPGALAARLSTGRSLLLRIEFPGSQPLAHDAVGLTVPGDPTRHWQARVIGPAGSSQVAGTTASGAQIIGSGTALLAEVATQELHVGQRLGASAQAGVQRSGAIVPNAAVLSFDSELWCYEQVDPEHFVRHQLPADAIVLPTGYLVAATFTPRAVVVHGASLLLSAEQAALAPATEED